MKSKGIIASLDFPTWLVQARQEAGYKSLNGFCKSNGFHCMTYCNKNKHNNYTLEDIVALSYIVNNAGFLRKIVVELEVLLREESVLKKVNLVDFGDIVSFADWFKGKLEEQGISLRAFSLEHQLNYNTIYANIRRDNFKEADKELMCIYLQDNGYFQMKKQYLQDLQ